MSGAETADHALAWPRDATHVLAVWTVSPATRVRALRALGPRGRHAQAALRLRDDGASVSIDVAPDATVRVLDARPATRYVVEIGLRTSDGDFVTLVTSPPVVTPPQAPARATEVTWVTTSAAGLAVATAWSGRRLPPVPLDVAGSRGSDAASR